MRRETVLGIAVLAVLLVSVAAAAVVPGVFAEPDRQVPPGRLDVRDVVIAPASVSGGTATLSVTTVLRHRGGPSENVSVRVQAIDLSSGMLESARVERVDPIRGDREVRVTTNLTVAREGGYRIETILYVDGRRIEQAARAVRGVGTLQPAYARSPVHFHRFGTAGGGLPAIQYSITGVTGNRTTIELSAYLTNEGDGPSEDLRLQFVVRQSDSNIVAARTSVSVGAIRPGHTATPSATVTIPDGYNYYLDAILWKDGVIVDSARSVANLDPTETIRANATVREVGLEVSDFERQADDASRAGAVTPPARESGGQPGFGIAVATVAVAVLGLAAWRRQS